MTTKTKTKLIPLLVTTAHKGVFFGYGLASDVDKRTIRLEKARMCVYWTSDIKGVLGLASIGPSRQCRIGLPVQAITVQDVVSVTECTKEAADKMETGPWV